jgi:hypothetical protein
MEKLTVKEYKYLIKVITDEMDLIRKDSYTNEKIADHYHDLSFIEMKLDIQLIELLGSIKEIV